MANRTKIATVLLLDVGVDVTKQIEHGSSFFESAHYCVSRIISRKIMCGEVDELTVVTIGSKETNNGLAIEKPGQYENITVLSPLQLPTWDLYERVEALKPSSVRMSDWFQGLIVALDVLKNGTLGKKITEKQIITFFNCLSPLDISDTNLETLASVLNSEQVKLIIIGINLNEEADKQGDDFLPGSMPLLVKLVDKVDIKAFLTFDEAKEKVLYFDKKRKTPRALPVTLEIGTSLKIPVIWTKFTTDEQRIVPQKTATPRVKTEPATQTMSLEEDKVKEEGLWSRPNISFKTDEVKTTYFGSTQVKLCYADLEKLKRISGPSSFTLIGFVKRSRINPLMFVGENIYIVLPKPKDRQSSTMLSSLVDALIKANKVGIARRILTKDGVVTIGALIPVSDDAGKHLYFLKLPTNEWCTAFRPVSFTMTYNEDKKKAVDDFIDAMKLPDDLIEEGKGVLVYNPNYQYQCDSLLKKFSHNNLENGEIPDYIKKLLDPVPELGMKAEAPLKSLNQLFPIAPKIEKRKRERMKFQIFGEQNKNNVATTSGNNVCAEETVEPSQDIEDILKQVTAANVLPENTRAVSTLDLMDCIS